MLFGSPSSVGQGGTDVVFLKIGKFREDVVIRLPGGEEPDERSNGHAHAPETRLSAHDFR